MYSLLDLLHIQVSEVINGLLLDRGINMFPFGSKNVPSLFDRHTFPNGRFIKVNGIIGGATIGTLFIVGRQIIEMTSIKLDLLI